MEKSNETLTDGEW